MKNPCRAGEHLREGHLGGTAMGGDPNSWYPELWRWLTEKFRVKSMFDVGCGLGYAQQFFADNDVCEFGVDGYKPCIQNHVTGSVMLHDFVDGPLLCLQDRCLVWCCEFAEHVEEKYVDHITETLRHMTSSGGVLAFCAAPPGWDGWHHVNCQPPEYWIDKLEGVGFCYEPELTEETRKLCPSNTNGRTHSYFQRSGIIFTRPKPMRLCFDVDGVVANDEGEKPYAEREPYPDTVEKIRRLKEDGHEVIFLTARYMRKFSNNTFLAYAAGYVELVEWLKKHDIPFDAVCFGKPSFDIVFDDRGEELNGRMGGREISKRVSAAMVRSQKRQQQGV